MAVQYQPCYMMTYGFSQVLDSLKALCVQHKDAPDPEIGTQFADTSRVPGRILNTLSMNADSVQVCNVMTV